jgi:DNA-binding winged helix-turn-helix (wHTH) protein
MSQQLRHIYEFGLFRLDSAERLLWRDGAVVPLQPKIFDLLLALLERPGRLVEKDELMKAVWPDTIVEEVNLANNISILRKTFSENCKGSPALSILVEETAEALKTPQRTVEREWNLARAWLYRELRGEDES